MEIREYGNWPPDRILRWAAEVGPSVRDLAQEMMARRRYPLHAYNACKALFRDTKSYPPERVDAACRRALELGAPERKVVLRLLPSGLENRPLRPPPSRSRPVHTNVRGGEYYDPKPMTATAKEDS